ncbi:MAG TPA: SurA N-terminal domain-containing protein [Nocardioidaceae bacterium]|nr:SurA N-terminal domain-containing protein [Nocardioidaceae bacterium]
MAGRRTKLAALAAGAMTVLAGCGLHPGAAAVVGSETISHDEVDDVARAVCSANLASAQVSGQPASQLPTREARQIALDILVETELSRQFGQQEGVEASPQSVSQAVAQSESGISMLPAERREDFRTALRDYAEGQIILIEIGEEELGGEVSDEEAVAEGTRLRSEYVDTLDVEIDPRYGTFEDGVYKPGAADLSVPASARARAGERAEAGEAFVSGLPASQLCS